MRALVVITIAASLVFAIFAAKSVGEGIENAQEARRARIAEALS